MSNSGSGAGTSQQPEDVEQGKQVTEEDRLKLYKSALYGDWDTAQAIYKSVPNMANAEITERGETPLHIATLAGHTHFVKKQVKLMSEEGLLHEAAGGCTAFLFAVITGKVKLAEAIMKAKKDLEISLVCKDGISLLQKAAVLGHLEMVGLLYRYNKDRLSDEDRKDLLVPLIEADMYDIALEMLNEHPNVAAAGLEGTLKGAKAAENEESGKTPLLALARKRFPIRKDAHQSWLMQSQTLFFCFLCILKRTCKLGFYNAEREQNLTDDKKAREILRCIWKVIALKDREIGLDDFHFKPIFLAAEQGNVAFLTIIVNEYPDILFKKDENGRTIFHLAVLNRQQNIFKFILKFGEIKNLINLYIDKDGNNILHLAGKLPRPDRLGVVPGAALQLQREIMWFEEVKHGVERRYAERKNKKGQTPIDLFERSHKNLMKEGEKWMTGTANSCTLVGTLIATVVFAAAFTVPGGNGQDNGIPIFLNEASFKVFVILDAISLIFSISSVVTFLSILTSRFRLQDFHKALPVKLFIGLSFLLFSMAAMMAAFMAAFFVVFKHGRLLFVSIPLAVLSLVPVLLFGIFHFNLYRDLSRCLKSIGRTKPGFYPKGIPCLQGEREPNEKVTKPAAKEK